MSVIGLFKLSLELNIVGHHLIALKRVSPE